MKASIVCLKVILFLGWVDLCHPRSLRSRAGNKKERQLERVCPFPEFEDAAWEKTKKYPEDIAEAHGKILGNDFVLTAGFVNGFAATTQGTYSLDLDEHPDAVWEKMDDYPSAPGVSHAAVSSVGDNLMYVCGGYVGGNPGQETPACYLYDKLVAPGKGQWTNVTDLPNGGYSGGALFYDSLTNAIYHVSGAKRPIKGKVLAFDYYDAWRLPLNEDGYPVDADGNPSQWEAVAPSIHRANHIGYVSAYDENGIERHVIFGGQDRENEANGNYNTTVEYIPELDGPGRWVKLQDMPEGRGHISSSSFAWGCGFITAGGALNGYVHSDDVLYYDFPTDTWHKIGKLSSKDNVPVCGLRNDYMHCEMPFGKSTFKRKINAVYPNSQTPSTGSPTAAPIQVPTGPGPAPSTNSPTSAPIQAPTLFEIRINAGSTEGGTDSNDKVWEADKYFKYGWTAFVEEGSIDNCDEEDEFIFRTGRHQGGNGLKYEIPVPNGNYVVFLYYNEFWHSDRAFNVQVENKQFVFDNLSLAAEAGGKMKAYKYQVEKLIAVDDGALNIDFERGNYGAFVNGIVVTQVRDEFELTAAPTPSPTAAGECESFQPIRINAGATEPYKNADGITWLKDTYFNSEWGKAIEQCQDEESEELCRVREGQFKYKIPVNVGCSYQVRLQSFERIKEFVVGSRIFNVYVEDFSAPIDGGKNVDLIDIVGVRVPYQMVVDVPVSDGELDIFVEKVVGWGGLLSTIEVVQTP